MRTRFTTLAAALIIALSTAIAIDAQAAAPAELLPLAWVPGTWLAHQSDGPNATDIRMEVRWAPTKRALQMDLTYVRGAQLQPFMTAMYVWHPGTKAITLWQVTSAGTVNEGQVVAAGETGVTQDLHSTDLDGTVHLLRTQFERIGADEFQFTSWSRATPASDWTKNVVLRFKRQ